MDDLSIVITIILGFATCISPPLVALINNHHARQIRKIELSSAEALRKIELNSEAQKQIVSDEYNLRYKAYLNFLSVASHYLFNSRDDETYSKVLSAYSECIMNGINWGELDDFMQYVYYPDGISDFREDRNTMRNVCASLESIADRFSQDLNDKSHSVIIE